MLILGGPVLQKKKKNWILSCHELASIELRRPKCSVHHVRTAILDPAQDVQFIAY